MYLLLFFIPVLLAIMAQIMVNSAYYKYSSIENTKGYTGEMVARLLLDRNRLNEVDIAINEKNILTNYYDPRLKTLHLTEKVYYGNSIAAITIAASGVAYAIQDDDHSVFLTIRNNLLPFSQNLMVIGWVTMFISALFQQWSLLNVGIYIIVGVSAFHIVTWPIEIKAKKQVMELFDKYDLVDSFEKEEIRHMSSAISVSYVASIVGLITLIIRIFNIAKRKE